MPLADGSIQLVDSGRAGQSLARTPGDRLRPPRRRQGGAVEHPVRDQTGPRARRDRDRARRARHERRAARRLPRPDARPHDRRQRRDRRAVGSKSCASSTTPTGSARAKTPCGGARRATTSLRGRAPADRELGVATLSEVLEGFPGVVLNLDIKRTAPKVVAYEEALARELAEHGRSDDVIVASFSDAAVGGLLELRARDRHRRRHRRRRPSSTTGCRRGSRLTRTSGATWRSRSRRALAALRSWTKGFVEAAHSSGLAVHVWTVDDRRRDGAPRRLSASTGSSPTSRACWRARSGASGRTGSSELSRDRSSASCRGWPSSSCGACA